MTRIIAGRAGSLRLEVPKSGTRPTSDRVREAIFSALESWNALAGARVLDLYAGSGALGLEAASRGATHVTLVEKHPQAAQIASGNARTVLKSWGGSSDAPEIAVERVAVQTFLEREHKTESRWDTVLLDPPYDLGETELAANLEALAPFLAPNAVVLVERVKSSPEPSIPQTLTPIRNRRYGDTMLWWYEPVLQ